MGLRKKVVVGQKEANQIFTEFHATPYGAHCGTEKNQACHFSEVLLAWNGGGH